MCKVEQEEQDNALSSQGEVFGPTELRRRQLEHSAVRPWIVWGKAMKFILGLFSRDRVD